MHTLGVTAHCEVGSYTHAVAEQVIAGIKATPDHTYELRAGTAHIHRLTGKRRIGLTAMG